MIRKADSFNNKSIYMLILAAALLAVIFAAQQQAYALTAFDAGYQQGKNDKSDGQDRNPRCPSGLTDGQCAVYRTGYEAGWAATSFFRPGDEPKREFNFDEDHGE